MSQFLKKLLSNSNEVSTMRLMSIYSLLVGSAIGGYGVYANKDLSSLAEICGVFVGSAFAGKSISKFTESKEQ